MAIITFSEALKKNGVKDSDVKSLGIDPLGQSTTEKTFAEDAISDIKQIGSNLKKTYIESKNKMMEAADSSIEGEQNELSGLYQAFGAGAAGVSKAVGDIATGAVKTVLPQNAEDSVKEGIRKIAEPIVNSDPVKAILEKYQSLDPKTKRNVDAAIGIGSLAAEFLAGRGVKAGAEQATKQSLKVAEKVSGAVSDVVSTAKDKIVYTIEDVTERIKQPDVSEATKVSLNPTQALKRTDQDINVSVGGKLKKLSEITPTENTKLQVSTERSLDKFTEQAKKFAKDRSVSGGSPIEIVGRRVDKALDFADKKRQVVGKKMGEIEDSLGGEVVEVGDNTFKVFTEAVDFANNPTYGMTTQNAGVVKKLVQDFDALEKKGLTVAERNKFIRSWDQYLRDAKDPFGNFKENATVNTKIQNAIRSLKTETVDAVAAKNKTYRDLRARYSVYKKLDEIGDSLLGKDGALGERIKGSSIIKRAIQSNSDAGSRQFLIKLRELTGYDAIKEGDIALTAMENVGDYQGLSLLNILKEGKTGVVNKALEFIRNKTVGNNEERVKKYIRK
jgi:hypothetical protein